VASWRRRTAVLVVATAWLYVAVPSVETAAAQPPPSIPQAEQKPEGAENHSAAHRDRSALAGAYTFVDERSDWEMSRNRWSAWYSAAQNDDDGYALDNGEGCYRVVVWQSDLGSGPYMSVSFSSFVGWPAGSDVVLDGRRLEIPASPATAGRVSSVYTWSSIRPVEPYPPVDVSGPLCSISRDAEGAVIGVYPGSADPDLFAVEWDGEAAGSFPWGAAFGRMLQCFLDPDAEGSEDPDESSGWFSRTLTGLSALLGVVGAGMTAVTALFRLIPWAVEGAGCVMWVATVPNGGVLLDVLFSMGRSDCSVEGRWRMVGTGDEARAEWVGSTDRGTPTVACNSIGMVPFVFFVAGLGESLPCGGIDFPVDGALEHVQTVANPVHWSYLAYGGRYGAGSNLEGPNRTLDVPQILSDDVVEQIDEAVRLSVCDGWLANAAASVRPTMTVGLRLATWFLGLSLFGGFLYVFRAPRGKDD